MFSCETRWITYVFLWNEINYICFLVKQNQLHMFSCETRWTTYVFLWNKVNCIRFPVKQGDTSDVLSVLASHLPIQLAKRYGEKTCFVKYHVSEDQSSVVRIPGGVQTLRNVGAYHDPTWHFNAQFVDKEEHTMADVQTAPGHGHFLQMKNTAYHCPYDFADDKVNDIYIV